MAGQAVNLIVEVIGIERGEPDILDSWIFMTDVKVADKEELKFHSNGLWSLPYLCSLPNDIVAGHIIKFVVKNPNPIIGTSVRIEEVGNRDNHFFAVLFPLTEQEVVFTKPCSEPVTWRFFLSTDSNMNNTIAWEAFSTWVPGMSSD